MYLQLQQMDQLVRQSDMAKQAARQAENELSAATQQLVKKDQEMHDLKVPLS